MSSVPRKKSRALVAVSVKNDSVSSAEFHPSEFVEYIVRRDNDVALSFAGIRLARAVRETDNVDSIVTLEATVYRTRGGKYITTLSKTIEDPFADDEAEDECDDDCDCECHCEDDEAHPVEWDSGYHKAAVHDTFEKAVQWFRPGRLTDEIRRQLGLDRPIRIE